MPRRGVGKTRYEWTAFANAAIGLAAGTATGFLLGVATQAETVMRIRGEILAVLDQTGLAANDRVLAAWGVMVMPAGSVAGGVIVSPQTNGEADWFAYGSIPLFAETAGADANVLGVLSGRQTIDSKAMRRMREGEEMVLVFENFDIAGAPAVSVTFGGRILTGE